MDFNSLSEWIMTPYVVIGTTLVATYLILFLLKRFILKQVEQRVSNSSTTSAIFIHSLGRPLTLLVLTGSLTVLNQLLLAYNFHNQSLFETINIVSLTLITIAVIVFFNQLLTALVGRYAQQSASLNNSQGIIKGITRIIVLSIGLLVLLSTLGISITPVIASLGITSLAVALALQPTLENFFSGVQLVIDKPFQVDDFIELESGEQGFVQKVGWRSTWIKMLANNTVVVPNSLISNAKVINYFYPQKELSVPVEVGVHYSSDLEHVERVTLEVARHILKTHEWGVDDYDTFVIFHTFADSSINFTVMLRAKEYFHQFFIKSAFIKALHKRFAEEGITIPYPIRAINTSQEAGGSSKMSQQLDLS